MKSQHLFWILIVHFLCVGSSSSAGDSVIDWKPYMSTPNNQTVYGGDCANYAAIHCMEGWYNYWYELPSPLELDISLYNNLSDDPETFFSNLISTNGRLTPISGSYPNFDHAYYAVAHSLPIPSSSDAPYPYNDLLKNVKYHLDNYGPVCIDMYNYSGIHDEVLAYDGETPIENDDVDGVHHWIVAVDYGEFEGTPYLECLNSFQNSSGGYYFRVETEYFNTWCIKAVSTSVHIDWDEPAKISDDDTAFNFYYVPKIYPTLTPIISGYSIYGSDDNSAPHFCNVNEDLYIVADAAVPSGKDISIQNRDIYISGTLIEPIGGYNMYRNDLVVEGTLTLTNCTINGGGYYSGAVFVDGGSLTIEGNVTIQNLDVGIYTNSDGLSITGSNNEILNCTYDGIVLDGASGADINNMLINEMGGYGIRIFYTGSGGDADKITIANSNYGIYLDAGASLELANSNIGLTGDDIAYDRLIQGGYGADFDVADNSNNVTFAAFYNGLHNAYESVDVGGNFWGSNTDTDKYAIFDDWVNTTRWDYRLATFDTNNGAPSPKIAAISPYEIARYYESNQDWTNAKNFYLQTISNSDDSMLNKRALKGLLRVYKNQEWRADDLRIMAENEYDKALNKHKPTFDYLYNETYMAEGDYFTAIDMFENCAEKYAGTSVEVMMLSRVANIYGDYLDDPATAKQYADRAAALNPGQPILMSAYMSAGILYEPDEYANKFEGVLEYYDIPEDFDGETASGGEVTVSPNPFNPSTVISYTLNRPSRVELVIYSITGQKVATLVDDYRDAGLHKATFDGSNLASGLYFYRFQSDAYATTGKLMILK